MKTIDVIMTISLAILVSLIIMLLFPVKLHYPAFMVNREIQDHKQLSLHVTQFKENKDRLPVSFEELNIFLEQTTEEDFSDISEKYGTNGVIIDCTNKEITFEVEAVWNGNGDDKLVWARTKDGQLIRFQKSVLQD